MTFTKAPHLVRNEFGFNQGGPVILPKIYNGKKRTFWFLNYEALRQAQHYAGNLQCADCRYAERRFQRAAGLPESAASSSSAPCRPDRLPTTSGSRLTGNVIPINRESPHGQVPVQHHAFAHQWH